MSIHWQVQRSWFLTLGMTAVFLLAPAAAAAETFELGVDDIEIDLPDGWSSARHANVHKIYNVPADRQRGLTARSLRQAVQITVHTERLADHQAALRAMRIIAAESGAEVNLVTIAGWPALQRRFLAPRPLSGQSVQDEGNVWMLTTAVAIGRMVVRFEAWAPENSRRSLLDRIAAIGASLRTSAAPDPAAVDQELRELRLEPRRGILTPRQLAPDLFSAGGAAARDLQSVVERAATAAPGTTTRVTNQNGRDSELEIAVADGGKAIVIGSNNGFFFSADGGDTWAASAGVGSNDPSITWGPSGGGTFYAANIVSPSTGFWTSTNGGMSFTAGTNAYTCGQNGDPACGAAFPDQEHLAADRFNQTAGGDQIYDVWRHLDGTWGIVCSQDSGANWSANGQFFNGDLPKVSVSPIGLVYVAYHPSNDDNIQVRVFDSCENGLNDQFGAILVIADPGGVACPTPGLDRCNERNSLASPIVAVDDTDISHVYIGYAANLVPGNGGGWYGNCVNQNLCDDLIVVQDSTDFGQTWPGFVEVSSGPVARRFMPWTCALGGVAHVAWYDRTAAFPNGTAVSNNSLTDFFRGSAFVDSGGTLKRGTEFAVNEPGSTDAQCEAGAATGSGANWPAPVDVSGDSESCSVQPQLGGVCCVPAEITGTACPTPSPMSSRTQCDFSDNVCPMGETCADNRGSPKYGDYNGMACAEGRLFMTWASATSPPTITPASTNIDMFFASQLVCCVPQIQVPGPVDFGLVCGDGAEETLEVCNTGAEDLIVGSITSDDADFAVTTPLGGFPVTISKDFCFDFEVTFDPSADGPDTAILTINSNDPVDPAFQVPVSAESGDGDLNVAIANAGNFGNVCKGGQADLSLTLFNQGTCNLTITDLEIVNDAMGVFELPQTTQLPLVLSPDADFNLPVRFSPDMCFDLPKNAQVRITSDDPDEAVVDVPISGTSPCPSLIIDPASVDGIHAFPATVVDVNSTLGCFSERTVVLRNNGACPLNISSILAAGVSGNPADFRVAAPTVFPILLPAGEETLNVRVRFTPKADVNPLAPSEVTGELTVVSDDPDGAVEADLCGESVRQSGVRMLVTNVSSGDPVPVPNVDVITLTSKGVHTPSPINLRFTDVALSSTEVCENQIDYHVDQETLPNTATTGANPKGSYTAGAKEGNLQKSESFGLGQCEFRDFQLQLQSSNSGGCLLAPKGASCTSPGQCCSGKCTGPSGGKTCK